MTPPPSFPRAALLAAATLSLLSNFSSAQTAPQHSALGTHSSVLRPQHSDRPNILFILADDLGYGDTGFTYQDRRAKDQPDKPAFSTPNLDRLAAAGITLTNHYTAAPVCAPARASLLTGQSQGHCAVRNNQFDKPIPDQLTLASMLKLAGYRTAAIGKWGLAGGPNSGYPAHPLRRGFDDFFGYMAHKTGHVYYHDAQHPLMDGLTDVGAQYENVYDTDLFTARAKRFITAQTHDHPDQPFFLYLAYTAVHNALNVPGQPYPTGAGLTGGLHWPLTPTPDTRNTWIHPDYANKPWTDPQKRYATMARRLDDAVGDLTALLDDLHVQGNTLIVFTSDNGPAFEGGADPRNFDSWGPFDGMKRDCWEGGVREPTAAVWPGHIKPHSTNDTPTIFYDWMPTLAQVANLPAPAHSDGYSLLPLLTGASTDRLASLTPYLATVRSTGGSQPPNDGRDATRRASSLNPTSYLYVEYDFDGKGLVVPDLFKRKHVTGRGQQQVVRIGDYAAVRTQVKSPADPLRLYNVTTDPHEDHNLAADPARAALLARMETLLVTARIPNDSAKRPYDDVPLPAIPLSPTPQGQPTSLIFFPGDFPYTPDFRTLPQPTTTTPNLSLPTPLPNGPFALYFDGLLNVPADGPYTFTLTTDGGAAAHLYLHDAHLIDLDPSTPDNRDATHPASPSDPAPHPTTATIHLRAGLHPFRLAYLHHVNGHPPILTLHWSSPTLPDQPIPPTALLHKP